MLRRFALVLVLALAGACAAEGPEEQAEPLDETAARCIEYEEESPGLVGAVTCQLEAELSVEVTGAEEFEDSGTYVLAIVEFFEGELPETTWFANMGMASPAHLSERVLYRVGFDIAPGTFRGPGTYELTDNRPEVEGLESPLTDAAFLEITSLEPERVGLIRYATFVEPCTVTFTRRLATGSLDCPRLADEEGNEITMQARWEPSVTRP